MTFPDAAKAKTRNTERAKWRRSSTPFRLRFPEGPLGAFSQRLPFLWPPLPLRLPLSLRCAAVSPPLLAPSSLPQTSLLASMAEDAAAPAPAVTIEDAPADHHHHHHHEHEHEHGHHEHGHKHEHGDGHEHGHHHHEHGKTADKHDDEDDDGSGKQSRSEKKIRKAVQKLGMKPVTGITRVSVKKGKGVCISLVVVVAYLPRCCAVLLSFAVA